MDNNKRNAYLSMEMLDSVDRGRIASVDMLVVSQLLRYLVGEGANLIYPNL